MIPNHSAGGIMDRLNRYKVVPVVVVPSVDKALRLAEILLKEDLPILEIVFRSEVAGRALKEVKEQFPQLLLGAGTVLTTEDIDIAEQAGVDFIVSPGFNPTMVKYAQSRGMTMIPGISNPSLAEQAMQMGLTLLKFFPAELNGGIPMIQALQSVYPQLRLMPTGGIRMSNLKDYLALQAVVACGGSWLIPKDSLEWGNWELITQRIRETKELLGP
jgi:2-dehydro-3-deoxyphosphogluconate aldolase/(4S)-4-hydroxy-2-oxoglutarate aldolase